jgi:caffeoyl-CoA O-methyltransferase
MVFIDANKSAYLEYLDWAINNTTRGGLIVGDNTFLFGGVYGESRNERSSQNQIKVMKEFNRRLADQTIFESCLIPTSEGLTVGIRK